MLKPEDLYSQAARFNVDLGHEPYLVLLMIQAATTSRPPKRLHDDDGDGEEHYFQDQIKSLRHRHLHQVDDRKQVKESYAWMAFEDREAENSFPRKIRTFYYNFVTKTRQAMHPLTPLINEMAEKSDSLTQAADLQEFAHAASVHKQTSLKNITELKVLCFYCWWNETSLLGETRQCRMRLYFAIATRRFQVVLEDSPKVFTISHVANAVTRVPLSVWDLHEGARLSILGRLTTLRQASLLTRQWLEVHERQLHPVVDHLRKELAKYELSSHGRLTVAPASGRILCADPHRSRSGVTLRQLLNEINMLQKKLATYRPDLACRLCEPLARLGIA